MKLGPEEKIIQRYHFNGVIKGDCGILTNQRLVMAFGGREDTYPLSKITTIRTTKSKLVTSAFIGFGLAWFSWWLYSHYDLEILSWRYPSWLLGVFVGGF